MIVNVVTHFNGRGLERDAEIVEALIAGAGHESRRVHRDRPATGGRADLSIFLEVVPEWAFGLAPRNWLIPNPEWLAPQDVKHLRVFDRVLCKTHHAQAIFARIGGRAEFVGFRSRDRREPWVPQERAFLCVVGPSIAKGGDRAIEAWTQMHDPPPLTMIGDLFKDHAPVDGVRFLGHVSDELLRHEQNRCLFALQPSWTEGFGHAIWEALSCGALVSVPDRPPMSEWDGCPAALRCESVRGARFRMSDTCRVPADSVKDAVAKCMALDNAAIGHYQRAARDYFVTETDAFERRMTELLEVA